MQKHVSCPVFLLNPLLQVYHLGQLGNFIDYDTRHMEPDARFRLECIIKDLDTHGMEHPIIVDGASRVMRGNQRVWYCIDNNIQKIGAYVIDHQDLDLYIQKTYIHKSKYPI